MLNQNKKDILLNKYYFTSVKAEAVVTDQYWGLYLLYQMRNFLCIYG